MSDKPNIEERASELFRLAGPAEPLSSSQLESVWKKTTPRLEATGVWKWWVSGGLLLVVAGAWFVTRTPSAPLIIAQRPTEETPAVPQQQGEHPKAVEVAKPVLDNPTAPVMTPLPTPPIRPESEAGAVRGNPVRAVQEEPPAEDPLLAESKLLMRAVAQLREQEAPSAALATLEHYAQQFPNGVLHREAMLTRVEALVAARRRTEARQVLESVELEGAPREDELRVLLGELLLDAGKVAEARASFEGVLEHPLSRDVEERARFGLAKSLREPSAIREALSRYLERFPDGRFALEVRARLEE